MEGLRVRAVFAACLAVAILVGPVLADCAPNPTPAVACRQAAAVFVGRVASAGNHGEWRAYEFDAEFAWKGVAGRRCTVLSSTPGCGLGCHFEVGRSYLVYAESGSNGLVAHNCSRTVQLAAAGEDLAALGRPPVVFPVEPAAGSLWMLAGVFALGLVIGVVAGARGWYARFRRINNDLTDG